MEKLPSRSADSGELDGQTNREPAASLSTETIHAGSPIPPIPADTKRTKWERTRMRGFPYAPHDEDGVIAIFSILCAREEPPNIPWDILQLNRAKGVDAICYDRHNAKEMRVELKYRLSRSTWDKRAHDVDCVVCWENRYKNFPKRVIVLREVIKKAAAV